MNLLEKYQAMISTVKTQEEVADTVTLADTTPVEKTEPGATVGAMWRNPYPQGTTKARQESLIEIMGAICQEATRNIRKAYESKQKQYKAIPHILMLEQKLEALQQAVLKGEAELKDFRLAAYEWQRAAAAELN